MSYTPHTWQTDEIITAAKMNNIEEGIQEAAQSGGGVLIVHTQTVDGTSTLDKTAQEIYDAVVAGTPVFLEYHYGTWTETWGGYHSLAPMTSIFKYSSTSITVGFIYSYNNTAYSPIPGVIWYRASSVSSYPTYLDSYDFFS